LFQDGKDILAGGLCEGKPVADQNHIWFNGLEEDDQGHETFQITKKLDSQFNFCKTARKPYDKYVCAVLLACEYYAPGALDIGSDGYKEEWQEGIDLIKEFLPEWTDESFPKRVEPEKRRNY
jgi:hypothetical protein